jgi:hypothetical protein
MSELRLDYLSEPKLVFGSGQQLESPKDGLFLFGPEQGRLKQTATLRIGVIGTNKGIAYFKEWIARVRGFIPGKESSSAQHRPFLGFTAVYGLELSDTPVCEIVVRDEQIDEALLIADRHVAIFKTVEVFADPIKRYIDEEESVVDVWFIVIPEKVFLYGRPKSVVPVAMRVDSDVRMDKKLAKELVNEPSLFAEDNEAAEPYLYEVNFHNQLKARLLEGPNRVVAQIVRETVVAPGAFLKSNGMPLRPIQDPATVAWNLCTTAYFKSGRRPWRLARVRDKVCYVGLVFKRLLNDVEGSACCGAQMFLDSGDGLVFKGAVGPWRSANQREYHVSREGARTLLSTVIEAYRAKEGHYPSELFIHGQTAFNDDEWHGFSDAVPAETNLVGVRIRSSQSIKLFRPGTHPILRGSALRISGRAGFLWTRGFVPYLQTYPGRETPNPLRIDLLRGDADLLTVMSDVMALTKLNFNACIYGDGLPVTLRFASAVGEILTAGPTPENQSPLPFKHYI